MTRLLPLQIALMTVFSTCILAVLIIIATGFGNAAMPAFDQIIPLAVACAAALSVIVLSPSGDRS